MKAAACAEQFGITGKGEQDGAKARGVVACGCAGSGKEGA